MKSPVPTTEDGTARSRLLFITAAMFVSWGLHDFLQESVFRQPGFTFGLFMAFCLQTTAVLGATATSLYNKRPKRREPSPSISPVDVVEEEPPSWQKKIIFYSLLACCIALANGLSSTALNYVNMPAKVLFKSSKLIPVMIIGILMGIESYRLIDYLCGALICAGLIVFSLAEVKVAAQFSTVGIMVLLGAIVADATAPNLQKVLLVNLKQTKEEVVYYTNWLSSIFTLATLITSGTFLPALVYLSGNLTALGLLIVQSIMGYLGILSFIMAIEEFGPRTTVIIASTRKMLTITVSYLWFQKPFNSFHFLGIALVLGTVTFQSLSKTRK